MLERVRRIFKRDTKPVMETKPADKAFSYDEKLWNREVKEAVGETVDRATELFIRCGCANCLHAMRGEMQVKHYWSFYRRDKIIDYDIAARLRANAVVAEDLAKLTNEIRAFETASPVDIVDFATKSPAQKNGA
jgi:hypothetical protein